MPVGEQNDPELFQRQSNLEPFETNKYWSCLLVRRGKASIEKPSGKRADSRRVLRFRISYSRMDRARMRLATMATAGMSHHLVWEIENADDRSRRGQDLLRDSRLRSAAVADPRLFVDQRDVAGPDRRAGETSPAHLVGHAGSRPVGLSRGCLGL